MIQEDFLVFVKLLKSKKKTLAELNPKYGKQYLPPSFSIALVVIVDDGDILTKSLFKSK